MITSVQLTELGFALMDKSDVSPGKPVKMADAIRYRDGFMIALLADAPLRHKNFAALEIGRDLIQEGEHWSIVVPPEETKTNTGLEFEIPEDLRERLSIYLKRVRPRMLKVLGCNAMWVSPKEGP